MRLDRICISPSPRSALICRGFKIEYSSASFGLYAASTFRLLDEIEGVTNFYYKLYHCDRRHYLLVSKVHLFIKERTKYLIQCFGRYEKGLSLWASTHVGDTPPQFCFGAHDPAT